MAEGVYMCVYAWFWTSLMSFFLIMVLLVWLSQSDCTTSATHTSCGLVHDELCILLQPAHRRCADPETAFLDPSVTLLLLQVIPTPATSFLQYEAVLSAEGAGRQALDDAEEAGRQGLVKHIAVTKRSEIFRQVTTCVCIMAAALAQLMPTLILALCCLAILDCFCNAVVWFDFDFFLHSPQVTHRLSVISDDEAQHRS